MLEYTKSVTLGKLEFGLMLSLKLFIIGFAVDFRQDDDYRFSIALGLGFISFIVGQPETFVRANEPRTE